VLTNPELPGPLQRPEYRLAVDDEASAQREQAHQHKADASRASHAAGEYVLMTLMFASVLFFGGIAGTFTDRRVCRVLACIALLLFAVTLVIMIRLPYAGSA
jgi:hypothetical protein